MPTLPERRDEIKRLLSEGDLHHATARLQDFARDFDPPADLIRQATAARRLYVLSRAWQAEAAVGSPTAHAPRPEADRARLVSNAHTCVDAMFDAVKDKAAPFPLTDIVCATTQLEKAYGARRGVGFRLHPVNLSMRFGEITAVVGENGNGKSTLIKILVGALRETGGEVTYPYFGVTESQHARDYYSLKQKVAYIPQDLPKQSGKVRQSLYFTGAAHGLPADTVVAEVEFMISRLGLDNYAEMSWQQLSGGYRMRFALTQALITRPHMLVLDEPLANLDINTQLMFLRDLRSLADSLARPLSILVSSQHLHEIESIADRVIFLKEGRTIYNGLRKAYGVLRAENVFECSCAASKDALLQLLAPLGVLRIDSVGANMIVTTPTSVTPAAFLGALLQHGVAIDYFRDISTSTRKLFDLGAN